ncbi:LOW QUALITY PROTEIN: hypothetical protein MXB_1198 [Myxobolus squamalis]|nr:LOW QUALITY PROTEIN: hypothetical protein MXB_1198 [Myxobolus squamalis]
MALRVTTKRDQQSFADSCRSQRTATNGSFSLTLFGTHGLSHFYIKLESDWGEFTRHFRAK